MPAISNEPPSLEEFKRFFLEEYEQATDVMEKTDRIPEHLFKQVAEIGTFRMTVPPELGGFGMTAVDHLPYLEVGGMAHGSARMLVHWGGVMWRWFANYGNREQRALVPRMAAGQEFAAFGLTERTAGTGRDIRSRAVRVGDSWQITGEKHLITFADRAHYFLLVAASDDRRAKDSLTAFLVPRSTEGFEIDVSQETMGNRGCAHAFLRYDKMVVEDSQRLGGVGQGLEVALSVLDWSRVSLSSCMVGLSQRALDESVAFSKRRVTFGRPIAERQAMQVRLAEMHTDIAAGRGLVREAATRFQRGEEFAPQAATAKLFCLNMVGRVTDHALKMHGGYGYTKDAVIERVYRDGRGFWFEEGTTEIQQMVIARHLLADGARR